LSICIVVLREELCCEFRQKPESLRILRISARWALSRCIEAQDKGDKTVERSVKKKKLYQEGIESACRQAQKRKEPFEFWSWRKCPLKDLH
jgi:hypothetical protein